MSRTATIPGDATDSRQLWTLESMATAVTMGSKVRHTRVGRALEYATPGL